jgi:DNA-binding PadR family transcriptional regulator
MRMTKTTGKQKPAQPLSHSEFHILLALADGERHGYGIMQEVETRSAGATRLGPGTLYGAIKRMLAAGLIEESANRPVAKDDDQRRRCYYRLTRFGRKIVVEEAERLAALVRVAEAKQLVGRRIPLITGDV